MMKPILSCFVLLWSIVGYANSDPGFFGKKVAVGYSTQFCLANWYNIIDYDKYSIRSLTNHNYYLEYASSKYTSVSANIIYQNIPVTISQSGSSRDIEETYILNGDPYSAKFWYESGTSDFKMSGFGLKFSLFVPSKTVSSPVGFCHYFRLDVIKTQILRNNYKYSVYNRWDLTQDQYENIIIPQPNHIKASNLSLAYGLESKISLSKAVFFRWNAEFNLSTALNSSEEPQYVGINKDLSYKCHNITAFRNMFQIGLGLGVLVF